MTTPAPTPDTTPPSPQASPPGPPSRPPLRALAAIGLVAGTLSGAFAWTAGWLDGGRLTAPGMLAAIEATGLPQPGYRRAHAKGVCVVGHFQATPEARALSTAPTLSGAVLPVLGRLSIGGGDPHGHDGNARVRSMALRIGAPDGPQWRMAMNSFPFMAVATPAQFHAQTVAARRDPVTGKPDPAAMEAFLAAHPRARAFQQWAREAPWSDSWANTAYNSINAFRFTGADGHTRHVRWSMQPHAPFQALDPARRAAPDAADLLREDLQARLADGPLQWDMVVTLAAADDAVDDPSLPWPATRDQVRAGTLTLTAAAPEDTGGCRDVNFDPLILPPGVHASADPILAARSAVYAHSFNRRQRETADGAHAADATPEARP